MSRIGAWAQLLRVSALFTVPGDAVAGAAASGRAPNRGTALAAASSLCLYEAGMALNDWADRETDAVERPERPVPSGRVSPPAALLAAGALTAAGLALAGRAGRPALATAAALATTVWAYDLRLNHTAAAPGTMAAARALDLVLGATATAAAAGPVAGFAATQGDESAAVRGTPGVSAARDVAGAAALMGAHTWAVTAVSRREAEGGAPGVPLAALGAVGGIAAVVARRRGPQALAATAAYVGSAARPLAHAALNPSPPLLQRAVGGGIRAMIPLQAALTARTERKEAGVSAASLLALLPLARKLSRKVSPT